MCVESARRGTSLIELVVALAVGGMLLVSARVVLQQVADATERAVQHSGIAEHDTNAERVLRAALGSTESATIVRSAVRGNSSSARIETWCDVPAGWQERCVLTLRVVAGSAENLLTADLGPDTVVIRRGFDSAALRYVADTRYGGTWLTEWLSQITVPIAVGIIIDADTLILRIGERG